MRAVLWLFGCSAALGLILAATALLMMSIAATAGP